MSQPVSGPARPSPALPEPALPAPALPSRADIEAAAELIGGRVRRTPVIDVEPGVFAAEGLLRLKLELLQHTGSFKPRGTFNRVLRAERPEILVAASGGNHGLAVAHVARDLGLRAEVFVPDGAPAVKVAGIRRLGADVTLAGQTYADAYAASRSRAELPGALGVHAYDDPEVVVGQGTVGWEMSPDVDTVLVAVGGGGLLAGIATWWHGKARVVAVEPTSAPTLHAALRAGRPVDVEVGGLAADSLGASRIGAHGFAVARAAGVASVLVDDDAIAAARGALWRELKVAAEPGGATALAALTSGTYRLGAGERVAVIVCGGNADPGDLGR
jgi:threonine dehydratase